MADKYNGRLGSAERVPFTLDTMDRPDHLGHIATWLITVRGSLFAQFMLMCIHLRDIEGQSRPPHLRRPDASHEVLVFTLNTEKGQIAPTPEMVRGASRLEPPNVVHQIAGATDEIAAELTEKLAWAVAAGHLPADTDAYVRNPTTELIDAVPLMVQTPSALLTAREYWASSIDCTLEHLLHGGHPEHN